MSANTEVSEMTVATSMGYDFGQGNLDGSVKHRKDMIVTDVTTDQYLSLSKDITFGFPLY